MTYDNICRYLITEYPANVYVDRFAVANTSHRYRVVRLWEQDPTPLLTSPALLPLAVLAQTNSPKTLLRQFAEQVDMIEELNADSAILPPALSY